MTAIGEQTEPSAAAYTSAPQEEEPQPGQLRQQYKMPRADPMASGGDHSGFGRRVLPLQTVTDGYTYFSCPGSVYVSIQTFNNGIDIGFGSGGSGQLGSAVYPPTDEYLALSNAQYPRNCDEIRFRNHVAGQVAQIQVTAQGLADLPSGTPLGVSIEPNFLTANSDGTVGAIFPGGVQLKEGAGAGAFAPSNELAWTDSGGLSNVRAFISALSTVPGHTLFVRSQADANDAAQLTLFSSTSGATSRIQVSASDSLGNLQFRSLLDSLARSDYLQTGASGSVLSAVGNGSIIWPGGSTSASSAFINPGFPNTLDGVLITIDRALASGIGVTSGKVISGLTFAAFAVATVAPPLNNTSAFSWLAWGT